MIDRIKKAFRRSDRLDQNLRDEIEFHIASRADLNRAAGQRPDDAHFNARRQFGNATRIQEDSRSMHISPLLDSILQDARFAFRSFRRTPAFSLTAITAIALGIAASTAVFSVVDRILFRSLPYANEDRLVWIGMGAPIEPNEFLLGPDYIEWRKSQTVFDAFTSTRGMPDCDITDAQPRRMTCGRVEANFLETFGVQPVVGRSFTVEEDRPNGPLAVMLSYGVWRSRYGGDPNVVGRSIEIDGKPTPIIGVLPADFELPNMAHPDLLIPQRLDDAEQAKRRTFVLLTAFGRLRPGVTLQQAKVGLEPLFERAKQFVPPQFRKEVKLKVSSLRERQTRDARTASWTLLASVVCILLIASANVANLLLARGAARSREQSVRIALGAGDWRIVRQSLTESAMLAMTGAVLGIAGGNLLLRALVAFAPAGIPRLREASIDTRVLVFGVAVALLCGLVFGIAPALMRSHRDLLSGARSTSTPLPSLRNWLISAQIATSVILLSGAGLLLQSLWKLQNVHLGIRPENVMSATVALNGSSYRSPGQRMAFFEQLQERVQRIAGVQSIALADSIPPGGRTMAMILSRIEVEGQPVQREGTGGMVVTRFVTPGYFSTLGIPIITGRGFTEDDRRARERYLIVSQSLARLLFRDGAAIGKRLRPGLDAEWHTVIGIAADVKNAGLLGKDDPEYYELIRRDPADSRQAAVLIVRSELEPAVAARWVRDQLREMDAHLPVTIEPVTARVTGLIARPRFNTLVLVFFAIIGLALAAVGLFGVLAFLVAQRSQEIGVRMALGATRGHITTLVIRHAIRWTSTGAALGVAGAFLTGRYLESLLYQTRAGDWSTMAAVLVVLFSVSLAAAWIPARRAGRVDPMTMLRHD